MGHGIGAVKGAGLPPFATAFAEQGYAAVLFDYLHWGQSDGEPRGDMIVSRELQDFKDVIAWVRSQPEKFDARRIVAWGSSFGGMHVTALMAQDHALRAGIAQCPCVDGTASSLMLPFFYSLKLGFMAVADTIGGLIGADPIYVNLVGDMGAPLSIMGGSEAVEGWRNLQPVDGTVLSNEITARSVLQILTNRPIRYIRESTKPYLIVLPTWDHQASLAAAERAVQEAPFGEALRVEGGHFDLYPNGPAYEKNLEGQLRFLEKVFSSE
ncbi:putative alpha/beta fold family hydrolase [Sarocladium strictum]